ncbi:MAG: transporter substrate-binding domain-containing protein [Motiliproteus sp.]
MTQSGKQFVEIGPPARLMAPAAARTGPFVPLYLLMLFLILLLMQVQTLKAETLTVYTEEFPPFNFTKDGTIQGVSTQVVKAVLEKAGVDYQLKSLPWARSFKEAQSNKNALIYSITRRQERESLLNWIGIVTPASHSAYALQGRTDISLNSLAEMKDYRIATQLEGARESYLLQNGFTEDDLLRLSGKQVLSQQYRMLTLGRIDIWPAADAAAYYVVRSRGDDPDKILKKVYAFSELSQGGYYLAASLSTPTATIALLTKTLEQFKQTDDYLQILKQWGLAPQQNP